MTCKDCIHYKVCNSAFPNSTNKVIGVCRFFGDKAKYIELPCKVGDVVYCLHCGKVKPCTVINYYYDSVGIMCDLKISQNDCSPNALTSINIIEQFTKCDIFPTREEAEKALKERENG